MKIAMMTYSLKPRGGVVHALSLAEAIRKKGEHIELFALRRGDEVEQYPGFFRSTPVPFEIFDFDWHQEIQKRLEAMISAYVENLPLDFDIYHAQDCVCDRALQKLSSTGRLTAPIVRTIHHVEGFPDAYLNMCEQEAIRGNTRKITVSKYWHDELLRRFGTESTVIYNGIEVGRYTFKTSDREPFVLFVGGMEARKGLEFAIEAMEILLREGHDLKLVAVARPGFRGVESKAWFDHLVERCGLTDRVEFIETIPDEKLIDLYARASAFLLTSRMEGWGLSIMEAMASGCPVVSASVGGVNELVENGKTGILVSPGDVKGFADAVARFLSDDSFRETVVENARNQVGKYSWDVSAERTIEFYNQILGKKR
ncbi:MAG: glycosyltransferase family 4 protein [Thermoplasmata archaeon]